MMIIDGHAHSSGEFFRTQDIVQTLDRAHVDKVVLAPGLPSSKKGQNSPELARWFPRSDPMFAVNRIIRAFTRPILWRNPSIDNLYVQQLTRCCPERIIQCYWINPRLPNALPELIHNYQRWHFKMIKFHQPSGDFNLNHPLLADIIRFAAHHQLPIFLHLHRRQDVFDCIAMARQFQTAHFIIAHLIGLEIFARCSIPLPNVYFDISPIPMISDQRILKAIARFGADHVLLGSDTPFGKDNLIRNIERVQRLDLSDQEKALILGENAQRLLNI